MTSVSLTCYKNACKMKSRRDEVHQSVPIQGPMIVGASHESNVRFFLSFRSD